MMTYSLYLTVLFVLAAATLSVRSESSPLCSPVGAPPATAPPHTYPDARLPMSLSPLHYSLTLRPQLQPPWDIEGQLQLHMLVVEATKNITLNMLDIVTHNDTVKVVEAGAGSSGRQAVVLRQTYDVGRQMYTVELDELLQPGSRWNISLQYRALLNDKLVGFYRSHYVTPDGQDRWLATTQFSPTDARRAFPGFDEPGYKSTFDVTLEHTSNMTARSNMPLLKQEASPSGGVSSQFARTPLMSTFIVAFHISDFEALPYKALNSTNFTVYSRPQVLDQATYAYSIAPAYLSYLEDYFNSSFPLPKLDMVAVPDFKFRGMENWGLIMYRETAMLLEESGYSPGDLFTVAYVIAHEISHQWFGNLVTPAWWSELWLKEGFASFMGYLAMDAVMPEWSVLEKFVSEYQQSVLHLDSLHTSHPINVPVNHPDQISEIFDQLSYKKGASVLRMLYNFVGERAFRDGLTNYLRQLQYASADQDDLWRHLTATGSASLPTGVTVNTIMNSWTYKKGYPVVNVTRTSDTITLTQEQFLLDGHNRSAGWWVPVTYTTASAPQFSSLVPQFWMTDDPAMIVLLDVSTNTSEWVALNLQAGGYYRVCYSAADWALLVEQLLRDHSVLPPAHRAALLDDAFSLARAGRVNYSVPLELSTYLVKEQHYVPWEAAYRGFRFLNRLLQQDPAYGDLQVHLLRLVSPWFERLGFEDAPTASYPERSAREMAIGWACRLEHEHCLNSSTRRLQDWLQDAPGNGSSVLPGMARLSVLCTGVAAGQRQVWDALWLRYLNSSVPALRAHIIRALACSKEQWLLARFLERAFTAGSGVRKQDAAAVLSAVAARASGRALAWRYLRDNWLRIVQYLGSNNPGLSSMVKATTQALSGPSSKQELEQFIEAHSGALASAERALQQARETVRLNTAWLARHYSTVVSWLQRQH